MSQNELKEEEKNQNTNAVLEKLEQLRQLRQTNGLLSSMGAQQVYNPVTMNQPGSSLGLLTSLAAKFPVNGPNGNLLAGSNGNSPATPLPTDPRLNLPTDPRLSLPNWSSNEELFYLSALPKLYLPNYQQLQQVANPSLPNLTSHQGLSLTNAYKIPQLDRERPLLAVRKTPIASKRKTTASGRVEIKKQKRTKWTESDLIILWESISHHGNEWQKVKTSLTGRTYHQVKDKGKRLLHEQGWETGRSKVQNDLACERAKVIAVKVLSSKLKIT